MKWTWDKFGFGDQSKDAEPEREVIGCMMLNPDCCNRVFELVSEQHFSNTIYQMLFTHIRQLYKSSQNFDLLALRTVLVDSGNYGAKCDAATLAKIFTSVSVATPERAVSYAKLLRDRKT